MSEKMRRQIRGLHQSSDNINEGVGYVQTAEGALNEVQDILQRINELSVKAANGTNTPEDREYIDQEIQQLKKEMTRIFAETTFNEQKIWEPDEILDGGITPLVTAVYTGTTINLTDDKCDVLPINIQCVDGGWTNSRIEERYCTGNFTVNAKEDGITVSWTGHNQKKYETRKIEWGELEDNNYRFNIGQYFNPDDTELFIDGDIKQGGIFDFEIAFDPADEATKEDIINAIDKQTISVKTYNEIKGTWEGTTSNSGGFNFSGYLDYWAVYDSYNSNEQNKHSFGADDLFLEPVVTNGTNLTTCPVYTNANDAKGDTTGWTFALTLEGIGDVTASSTRVTWRSNYFDPDDKGTWWHTVKDADGRLEKKFYYYEAAGTLAGVMDALDADGKYGLLSPPRGDHNGNTGSIYIGFTLTAADGKEVGVATLSFTVNKNDTMDAVFTKIRESLNGGTIIDFATNREYSSVSYLSPKTEFIDTTRGACNFFIQAGTESGQHISIKYDALNIYVLGMTDTNVLTQEAAGNAIDEVKKALQIVSKQRSDFGAYQNRLEHAYNINKNVEENTQSSESVIRDTDIAEMMMEYSVNNILMQAGSSMLTQANQSKQSVLELLN